MLTIVIKPCPRDEDWNIVAEFKRLHTTEVENCLFPSAYTQKDPRKLQEIFQIGNYMHSVIQTTAVGGMRKWVKINDLLLNEISTPQEYVREKEWEFLKGKLQTHELVNLSNSLYADIDCVWIEKTSTIFIECGKYYCCICVKADLIDKDWDLRDIKSAWGLWIKNPEAVYTKDNYFDTCLAGKRQWIWYTVLHWLDNWVTTWEKSFIYDIFTKHKKTQMQSIKCMVDLEWWRQVLENDIKNYFTKLHNERHHL